MNGKGKPRPGRTGSPYQLRSYSAVRVQKAIVVRLTRTILSKCREVEGKGLKFQPRCSFPGNRCVYTFLFALENLTLHLRPRPKTSACA